MRLISIIALLIICIFTQQATAQSTTDGRFL